MTRALMLTAAALAAVTMAPQSDDFPSGNVFGSVGATTALTLDPGGAASDAYTVHYFVSVTINGNSTTFSTASLVVAIDANDGSGWVERASFTHNCSYFSGPPPYSTRTCTFSHEQPTITVAGLGLGDGIRLRAKSFTPGSPTGGSFAVRGGDGGGSNPETYNGVTYTTVDPTYTVAVTPDGGSASAFSGSTGNQLTFNVQNLGNQGTLTYSLNVVGCSAPLTNCTTDASVTVGQGATGSALVRFDAGGSTGIGTITLRATHGASGTSDDGTFNVTVSAAPSYAVEVGPDPGSQSATAGTSGNVATFWVRNDGNQGTQSYQLSIQTCGAPLTNCRLDASSVSVGQNLTENVVVRFDVTSSTGGGAIVLRATHNTGALNDGTINVTVMPPPSYAVEVGDPPSQSVVAGSVNHVASFPVTNNGNQGTLTYALSIVTCTAPLTNCRLDAGSISVNQNSTGNAIVRFDAQVAGGSGMITVRATHTSGTSDDGLMSVTVAAPTYTVAVGPDGGTGGAIIGSTGNVVTFTVRNDGNQGTLTYGLSVVGCTAPLVNCTTASSIPVAQGTTQNATVQFDAQNTAGTGTITLRATHAASGASDDGTINVTITTGQADDFVAGNLIDALGETAEANLDPGDANSGLYTVHFFVEVTLNAHSTTFGTASLVVAIDANDGSGWVERGSFTYNCSYLSGPPPYPTRTCPALAHEQRTITAVGLALNDDIRLRAKSFSTDNGAGGSFRVRGGDGAGPNPETYSGVTYGTNLPPSYAVAVGPDPGSQSVTAGTTGNVATFTVRNDGNQGTLTYALSIPSCVAPVASCTSDSASITVGQGLTKNATVRFNAQSTTGAGAIVLRATHTASGTLNDGTINVTVTPPPSFAVEVGDPPSQSIASGSTNHFASFPVQNIGNQGTLTYALSIVQCTAPPLTTCTSDSTSLTIGQGLTKNAVVRFGAQSTSGPGTIVLRATHVSSGTSNDGTLNVTVAPASYAVQVGPDPGTQSVPMGSTGNVATFTIKNEGNQGTLIYQLSLLTCTAPMVNCSSDSASLSVGQGVTRNATVRFDALNTTGTGTIALRATHTGSGATDDGTVNVTITTSQADDFVSGNLISTVGGTAEADLDPGDASGGRYTVHYFVDVTINAHSTTFGTASLVVAIETNDGSGWIERATFSYNCSYLSGPPPYPVRTCPAATHEQQTITVAGLGLLDDIRLKANSFSTDNGAGGSFRVRGGDGSGSNPETYNGVTYQTAVPPSYAVEVGPDPGSASVVTGPTRNMLTFTVQNQGNQGTLVYQLNVLTCAAPVTNCTSDSASISVGQGLSKDAVVRFDAPSGTGMGTVVLRGTHPSSGATNDGTFNVTVSAPPSYTVQVGPDPGAQSANGGTTGNIATFTVKNEGNQGTLNYALSVVGCTTPLTNCTADAPSIDVAQGVVRNTTVRFDAQGIFGTGTITLRGTHTGSGTSNDGTIDVTVIALSSVSGGVFTLDSRFVLVETAVQYDPAGRITESHDARAKVTRYRYGLNDQRPFMTEVRRVNDAGGPDLVTRIGYNAAGLVDTIIDEGGSARYFHYDAFARLDTVSNTARVPVMAYRYTYSRTNQNAWVFQPPTPNAITSTTFLQQAPLRALTSTEYFDGLGRSIQTVVRESSDSHHVTATQYDSMGRVWRAWNPYTRSTAGYDPNFAANATQFYLPYGAEVRPYAETRYMADPLSRQRRVYGPRVGATPTDSTLYAYGVDPVLPYLVTDVTDESGKRVRRFMDGWNRSVQTVLGYGSGDASTTMVAYDVLDRQTQVTDPRGLLTTHVVNTRGRLSATTNPDAGLTTWKYDAAGNLRFTQDANQRAAGQVLFTTYDFAARPLVSGLGVATFSALNPDASGSTLEVTQANWLVVRAYDVKPSTAVFPWNRFTTQINGITLANTTGRLTAIASKSNGAWQVTLLRYDAEGEVARSYTYTESNSGTSVLTNINTSIVYTRDLRGSITQRALTVGSRAYYHWYDYNNRGLLWRVYSATGSTKPTTPDVTDWYDAGGAVLQYQFQGGPQVPLHYTLRRRLDRVGDPASTLYPFSARYLYNPNGTVAEAEFYNAGAPLEQRRYRYAFPTYDALNRLKSADFWSWNGSWVATPANDLANIQYDRSGNLLALQRYREAGTLIDRLAYAIDAASNRLMQLTDSVPTTTETWDAESGPFTYDPNGNIKTAPAPYSITAMTYNHQNLPTSLTRAGITTTYRYNHMGERISKRVGASTEVYILEGTSKLGVFTLSDNGKVSAWYFNVLAADRVVGRQPSSGSRRFYHTDLLGSTRAVTQGTTVVESYDYEPWGLLMPGRSLVGATKERFGAKERDAESGFDYYGARFYMPAVGRWASVDPAATAMPEWSPYNFVFDNPVSQTDPDGRQPHMAIAQLAARHPEFTKGVVDGVVDGAKATWHMVTHPKQTAQGIGMMAAALLGDPVAQAEVGQAIKTTVNETIQMWNSGEYGRGRVIGRLAEFGGEMAVGGLVAGAVVKVGKSVTLAEVTVAARVTNRVTTVADLPPFVSGGKTMGVVRIAETETPLISGIAGPAASTPSGTRGFDIVTRTHVEGHAVAAMKAAGATEATLVINNVPCGPCTKLLPRMLDPGQRLRIIGPNGYDEVFEGVPR